MKSMNGIAPSEETLEALYSDIRTRIEIQKSMASNTQMVLELELGISLKIIYAIEHGRYDAVSPHKVTARIIHEVQRRRQIYNLGKEALEGYSVRALCERYNLGSTAIERRIRLVKDQMMHDLARRMVA